MSEIASSISLRENKTLSFCDGELGDIGGVNAIFSRLEVVDDVISGWGVETFQDYLCVNLRVAASIAFF